MEVCRVGEFTVKIGRFSRDKFHLPVSGSWHLVSYYGVAMENNTTVSSPKGAPALVGSSPIQNSQPSVRVWLVDDNEELRKMVAELLDRLGGIECSRHFSSPDALLSTLASKPGPDVILLDVQMGDRNGLDAVRPIKSLTPSTRVLMFTTANNRAWRDRALGEGASDYLLKSYGMDHIAERIRTPSQDPAPGLALYRHRSIAPKTQLRTPQPDSVKDRSPRLLSRTLKMLRIFSN
jgi:DNA-binding NarL/FixJ family response regulator